MSHLVEIQTEVRDAAAVAAACQRLQMPQPSQRTVQLFAQRASGLAVELPGWRYPVVCDLASGRLRYDHYGGRWGDPHELSRFLQAYAVEKTRIEARRLGHSIHEHTLADGSIRLIVQVAGDAA